MRDHHDCISHIVQLFKQPEDLLSAAAVQRAGGLVSKKKRGISHQCPRDGRTLLLPAGQLRRLVRKPVVYSEKPDGVHTAFLRLSGTHAAHHQRHDDVLQDIISGNELIVLKNEADLPVSDIVQLLFLHFVDGISIQIILSVVSQIHAADDVHQRGFSGAGGPEDGDKFPFLHLKADVLQDGHLLISQHITLINVVHVYNQFTVDFHIYLLLHDPYFQNIVRPRFGEHGDHISG